jgi:GNAT superfamily N-acetyltransferase
MQESHRNAAPHDLARAAALSALAGWNQTAADWQAFLRQGRVRVLDDGDPACLAATAAVLPFGLGLAWISMVLVRPDRRRAGLATVLMRWALDALEGTPCVALDATPAGREVYRDLGFRDLWGFTRWRLATPLPPEPGIAIRPLRDADWPALLALDTEGFGAPRQVLLRDLARRLPEAAVVAEGPGGLRGFALGRDGVRAPQIGPVLARDEATGRALLAAAQARIGAPALLDARDEAPGLAAWLAAHGAERERPFTRMARGASPPGDAGLLLAMAGPEFG